MYSIKIIEGNTERALDMLTPSFPYNFESSSVEELKDTSASWSYTITLPRTANNNHILGYAGMQFAQSNSPYVRKMCNVYSDGVRIINRGVLFIDSTTDNEYHVQILSGIADIFERMKDIKFTGKHNNFETFAKLPYKENPESLNTQYARNLGSFYYDNSIVVSDDGEKTIGTLDLYTMIYFFATPLFRIGDPYTENGFLARLLKYLGYSLVLDETLTHNIGDEEKTDSQILNTLMMSLPQYKAPDSHVGEGIGILNFDNDVNTGVVPHITNTILSEQALTLLKGLGLKKIRFTYSLKFRADNARWDRFIAAGGIRDLTIKVFNGESQVDSKTISLPEVNPAGTIIEGDIVLELEENEYEGFRIEGMIDSTVEWQWYGDTFIGWNVEFESNTIFYPSINDHNLYPGQTMPLEYNTGFSNAYDIFKMICQVFGWIVSVDYSTRTIYAYSLQHIINNKPHAVDWSDKIIMDSAEAKFEVGNYARTNIIAFEENQLTGDTDEATFDIPNDNLAEVYEMIKFSTNAGKGNEVIQFEATEKEGFDKYKRKTTKTQLVYCPNDRDTRHLTASDIMLIGYQSWSRVLSNVMFISVNALLTITDIVNFDRYNPIYLRQYGAYFYVNKIGDWEDGKLCKVELLKI